MVYISTVLLYVSSLHSFQLHLIDINMDLHCLITEPLLQDVTTASVPMQVLQEISVSGPLWIPYGSADSIDGELNVHSIVTMLCEKVKSSKLDSKVRVGPDTPLSLWLEN